MQTQNTFSFSIGATTDTLNLISAAKALRDSTPAQPWDESELGDFYLHELAMNTLAAISGLLGEEV